MIIELPSTLKAWIPIVKWQATKIITRQAVKEILLCILIAGIGILGTYYLMHTGNQLDHITILDNTHIISNASLGQ